eukprot:4786229-Alexandrium_andersonii.AAC.1
MSVHKRISHHSSHLWPLALCGAHAHMSAEQSRGGNRDAEALRKALEVAFSPRHAAAIPDH